jgi:hypothetical protein
MRAPPAGVRRGLRRSSLRQPKLRGLWPRLSGRGAQRRSVPAGNPCFKSIRSVLDRRGLGDGVRLEGPHPAYVARQPPVGARTGLPASSRSSVGASGRARWRSTARGTWSVADGSVGGPFSRTTPRRFGQERASVRDRPRETELGFGEELADEGLVAAPEEMRRSDGLLDLGGRDAGRPARLDHEVAPEERTAGRGLDAARTNRGGIAAETCSVERRIHQRHLHSPKPTSSNATVARRRFRTSQDVFTQFSSPRESKQ